MVFILPLPVDIERLAFWLRFMARLSAALPSGEPLVNTSPADTAPLGSLGTGAVPLGTSLGLEVLGEVWAGVVWARAVLALHKAAATKRCVNFMGRKKEKWGPFKTCTAKATLGLWPRPQGPPRPLATAPAAGPAGP